MSIKFRDCPYCGRGIIERLVQSHIIEHHLQNGAIADVQKLQTSISETDLTSRISHSKTIPLNELNTSSFQQELEHTGAKHKAATQDQGLSDSSEKHSKKQGKFWAVGQPVQLRPKGTTGRAYLHNSQSERLAQINWQLALLDKNASQTSTRSRLAQSPRQSRIDHAASTSSLNDSPLKSSSPKGKFIDVSENCSCGGENENCFKCYGTGTEIKTIATTPGHDTTLFANTRQVASVSGISNDSRGGSFSIREKGSFDSRPLHDDHDEESSP